jgi:hypothetical protein
MFANVTCGKPWWYWFDGQGYAEIFRVIRDGSGGLWVEVLGHGVSLDEFEKTNPCLGPVAALVARAPDRVGYTDSETVHLKKDPDTDLPMCECGDVTRDFLTTKFKEVTCRKCKVTIRKACVD